MDRLYEILPEGIQNLPLYSLNKFLNLSMSNLHAKWSSRSQSDWLVSLVPLTDAMRQEILYTVKAWVRVDCTRRLKKSPCMERKKQELKEMADNLRTDDLITEPFSASLIDADGQARDIAWRALHLQILQKLQGKTLVLNRIPLQLNFAGTSNSESELISAIQSDGDQRWSLGIRFSLQTVPPENTCQLVFHCSRHRWINGTRKEPFLPQRINGHVWMPGNRMLKIPLEWKKNAVQWDETMEDLLRLQHHEWELPEAGTLIKNPEMGFTLTNPITFLYKNGYEHNGFNKHKAGTGVSLKDLAEIHDWLGEQLQDIVDPKPITLTRISRISSLKLHAARKLPAAIPPSFKDGAEPSDKAAFQQRLLDCTGRDIHFEIWYQHAHKDCAEALQSRLLRYIEPNASVSLTMHEWNDLALPMQDNKKESIQMRSDDVYDYLCTQPKTEKPAYTAALVILPGPDHYLMQGDPLTALRSGFARAGRLTQFLIPWRIMDKVETPKEQKEQKANEEKMAHACFDLFRALGFLWPIQWDKIKRTSALQSIAAGAVLLNPLHPIQGKRQTVQLPVYVLVDYERGSVMVECRLWQNRPIPYAEACLRLAQASWQPDFNVRCIPVQWGENKKQQAEKTTQEFGQCLQRWKRDYAERDCLVYIEWKRGNYDLCPELSNRQIQRQAQVDSLPYYHLAELCGMNFNKSNIRVMRLRRTGEVPEYIARDSEDVMHAASGLFQSGHCFYVIGQRPNDPQYTATTKNSIVDNPTKRFANKDLIEIYPALLQPGDDPIPWLSQTVALGTHAIAYDEKPLALPLPIYPAKGGVLEAKS